MFGFEFRTAFTVLLLAVHIFGASLTHHNQNETVITDNKSDAAKSSSVDISAHGSKLIQPVPLVADHPHHVVSVPDNFTNLVRLEDVLMVFDVNQLATKWPKIKHELKSECAQDMTEYFRGLQQHKMWATKSKCIL